MKHILREQRTDSLDSKLRAFRVLDGATHPQGINIVRYVSSDSAGHLLPNGIGHILSVARGRAKLFLAGSILICLCPGRHAYLPPGSEAMIVPDPICEYVLASAESREQSVGTRLIVRDEEFLKACASDHRSLRWILTSQYLSRRIFLDHDWTLASRSGDPVSWFHTTMFDSSRSPTNDGKSPVFRMSYDYRTEINICYEVVGVARVRFLMHPYADGCWTPWAQLDSHTSYHLHETPEDAEVTVDGQGCDAAVRNRHEVSIRGGHVSLFCMFDPAVIGCETHCPGEYSSYGSPAATKRSASHHEYLNELSKLDGMIDRLSLACAQDGSALTDSDRLRYWGIYWHGLRAQMKLELSMMECLQREMPERVDIVRPWLCSSGRPTDCNIVAGEPNG